MPDDTKKDLGLLSLTTLVAGNMIGSGIFLLPSNLAHIGSVSLFSWILTSLGAFCLAIVFSHMSLLVPRKGGPYAYAGAGFGDFIAFQTAYSYWIAVWVGNAGIVIAMVGYLTVFWPILNHPVAICVTSITTVWLLTLFNIHGLRTASLLQLITTFLKLLPILLIALFGWFYFHPLYLTQSFNVSGQSNFTAISNGAALTLWAFIGLESATIPSASVRNPKRNIPLATILGTTIAIIVYITSSTAIMGMIPAKQLAASTSPFADAANIILGTDGKWFIAAGAAISCFGCLNGWILLQGQVAMAAADDSLFPKIFSIRNKAGIPAWGLIITSILITLLLLMTTSPNLVEQFQMIILIAALTSLVPYLFTSIAEIIVIKKMKKNGTISIFYITLAIIGAAYAFWAIFGSGEKIIFYGMMLIFTSIPIYGWLCWQRENQLKLAEQLN